MKPANPRILAISGGSSSIKFARFEAGNRLRRIPGGEIERIGMPAAALKMQGPTPADNFTIDRLPQTGDKGIYLKQRLEDKLVEHKQYINKFGENLPEIR